IHLRGDRRHHAVPDRHRALAHRAGAGAAHATTCPAGSRAWHRKGTAVMTPCTASFDRLNAYVDGELLAADQLEVRRHLDVCAICTAQVESLLAIKDAVAASAELRPVPHTLRERLAAHAGAGSRWGLFRAARLGLLAAAALLAIVMAGDRWAPLPASSTRALHGGSDRVIDALVADHLHFLQEPNAVE